MPKYKVFCTQRAIVTVDPADKDVLAWLEENEIPVSAFDKDVAIEYVQQTLIDEHELEWDEPVVEAREDK